MVVAFYFGVWFGWAPYLLKISINVYSEQNKKSLIRDVGRWEGSNWVWDLKWRRNLFVWEEELRVNMEIMLNQVQYLSSTDDE
jgi:hypothetical protein